MRGGRPLLASLGALLAAAAPAQAAFDGGAGFVLGPGDRLRGDRTAGAVAFSPRLTAASYIAIDARTGRVLVSRKPDARRPIASLTKIMTGLLTAEAGNDGWRVKVPKAATLVEPTRDDLVAGRPYRRWLLLRSAMLLSANDSAFALGFDGGGGSLPRFFARMNERAWEMGAENTTYASPNGLDDVKNQSTARDQAIIARAALRNPVFASVVRTRTLSVPWAAPVIRKEYVNHNKMLWSYAGTYGLKTGWTTKAQGCLVVAVRRNGREIIGVVLGSANIWTDMPRLIDAALARPG